MIYRYYAQTGGWRLVVMYHEGRTWLKLLDASTLQVYRIARDQHRNLVPYAGVRPKTLARMLRHRRARMKRCHVSFPKKAVEIAIRKIEACPSGPGDHPKPSSSNITQE